MVKRSGMSLVELLLYLSISMTLFLMSSSVWISMRSLDRLKSQHEGLLNLAIALTCWASDVRTASHEGIRLRTFKDTCIMQIGGADVGWFIKNRKLIRCLGSYDSLSQKWSSSSTSTLVNGMEKAQFTCTYSCGRVSSVHAYLKRCVKSTSVELCLRCSV